MSRNLLQAVLDHNRLSMFQKQPNLPEEKAEAMPLSLMSEQTPARTTAKEASPGVTNGKQADVRSTI